MRNIDRQLHFRYAIQKTLSPLVLTLLLFISAASAVAQTPYKVTVDKNVMVSMRDGIRLATDIYRPDATGTFPAILVRTPYNKDGSEDEGQFFAQHGYVYVVQDTRGRYASEGNFNIYAEEGPDGYDTAVWINQQPWFNKEQGLALYGGSYMAATALGTALLGPPDLKAMYVYIASANYHEDGAWRGGAYELAHNVNYGLLMCQNQVERALKPDASTATLDMLKPDIDTVKKLEEQTPLDLRFISDNCPWYRDQLMNEAQNWFWDQAGYDHEPYFKDFPKVPVAFLGGWYDQFLGGTLIDYAAAKKYTGQPVSLVIGPWIHGGNETPEAGIGFFGKDAVASTTEDAVRWFDHFMKGVDNGTSTQPEVRYFLMGGGSGTPVQDTAGKTVFDIGGVWKTAPSWPLPNTEYIPYYLHEGGVLSPVAPGSEAPSQYDYDPSNPVPTLGGNMSSANILDPAGAQYQTCQDSLPMCNGSSEPLSARSDVLSFQTAPLTEDVTVAGPLTFNLWASSSVVDTDFTAKLVDVYPDGTAINVADGLIRARYRNNPREPELLKPGEAYSYKIDLWDTATVFKAGHRIRVDISSSNFPHYDRNLNTGNPIGSDLLSNAVTAHQTVFHDSLYPSNILLPIVPTGQ